MSKRVTILGKFFVPIWLIIMLLVATGAGATTGTLLAGKVVEEINVSTVGGAGLLVGEPLVDILKHTPNDASEAIANALTTTNPVTAWPVGALITDHSNIDFSDDIYETTTTAVAANYAQQQYQFYVGDAANITKIVLSWEGKVSLGGLGTSMTVFNGATALWDATMS